MNRPHLMGSFLDTARTNLALLSVPAEARWDGRRGVELPFKIPQGNCSIQLRSTADGLALTVCGDGKQSRKLLRNILLWHARLVTEPEEYHLLTTVSAEANPRRLARQAAAWIQQIQVEAQRQHALSQNQAPPAPDEVLGFWWDIRANFGDVIGPWLIEAMTGRPVLSARFMKIPGRRLASVGSIIQMITRDDIDIWGSGLIKPFDELDEKKRTALQRLSGVTVHAVRGRLTQQQLVSKLGWEVPDVYGDPALLFPRYFQPEKLHDVGIALVPHYHHRRKVRVRGDAQCTVIDVREDLRTVISQIANARVCISTSLHGIIIAQAYGVPWVWLNIADQGLVGGRFKFEDFFSTVDAESVAEHQIDISELSGLDVEPIAARAALPELRTDVDALEAALPLPRTSEVPVQADPSFSWKHVSPRRGAGALRRFAARQPHRVSRRAKRILRPVVGKK